MANAVYIIGNGFDLRMGMPTDYPSFLKYYKTLDTPSNEIGDIKDRFLLKIKRKISEGQDKWKDLEVALGAFTKGETNIELFKNFCRNANRELINYLKNVEKQSPTPSEEEKDKFFHDLESPEQYLRSLKLRQDFLNNAITKDKVYSNIISFNYTSTIERLLDGHTNENSHISVRHIHRTLKNDYVLFGVNNAEQIENEEFRKDEALLDLIVKPKGNAELGENIDAECANIIRDGHIFYIYGTSLGTTDKIWWDSIALRYKSSNSVILYFDHENETTQKYDIEMAESERQIRSKVINAMGLPGKEGNYRNRIYVVRNADIFPYREIKDK
jgi:hypothetical protein